MLALLKSDNQYAVRASDTGWPMQQRHAALCTGCSHSPASHGEGALQAVVLDVVDVLQHDDGQQGLRHPHGCCQGPPHDPCAQ